jgi:hypothetical protein
VLEEVVARQEGRRVEVRVGLKVERNVRDVVLVDGLHERGVSLVPSVQELAVAV